MVGSGWLASHVAIVCKCSLPSLPGLLCRCEENWFGDDCSQFVCDRDEDSNPCMNNGTCYPHRTNSTEYQCACGPDFWGEHCQYEVNAGQLLIRVRNWVVNVYVSECLQLRMLFPARSEVQVCVGPQNPPNCQLALS